jgi:transposase
LLAQAHPRWPWWQRVREGTLRRATLRSSRPPLRREGERFWEAGRRGGVPQTAGTWRDILKRREALGTFGQVAGVEPPTNTAERAIRPGVLWRKGICGTQSAEGSRFVESLLTVVAPLQQQQRNVLESLTTACEAALRGEAAPSLLPASEQKSQAAA